VGHSPPSRSAGRWRLADGKAVRLFRRRRSADSRIPHHSEANTNVSPTNPAASSRPIPGARDGREEEGEVEFAAHMRVARRPRTQRGVGGVGRSDAAQGPGAIDEGGPRHTVHGLKRVQTELQRSRSRRSMRPVGHDQRRRPARRLLDELRAAGEVPDQRRALEALRGKSVRTLPTVSAHRADAYLRAQARGAAVSYRGGAAGSRPSGARRIRPLRQELRRSGCSTSRSFARRAEAAEERFARQAGQSRAGRA